MGSSCFARGNNRNIEAIQRHLASREPVPVGALMIGHLCQGRCTSGPNITVDGQAFHAVDPAEIAGLLGRPGPGDSP